MARGKVWWAAVPEGAVSNEAIAGILSTRGFASAYFSAGTNRRATAFVLKYFLCPDMEKLHDVTIQDNFVRQDVSLGVIISFLKGGVSVVMLVWMRSVAGMSTMILV